VKNRLCIALLASLVLGAVTWAAGKLGQRGSPGTSGAAAAEKPADKEKQEDKKPAGPPPLVISKDAPRLSDAPAAKDAAKTPRGPVADNESCYCCHTNYREESFVVSHANGDVGCIKCHGESLPHRNDEDNVTPPDIMIAPDGIEKNCQKCHDSHDAPADKVIARWQEKCPARTSPKELLCLDCHGEHRLRFRTIWWDKKTGKLGARAEGERIRMAPDLTKVSTNQAPPQKKAPPEKKPLDKGAEAGEEMR
jgi:hypothetical protein